MLERAVGKLKRRIFIFTLVLSFIGGFFNVYSFYMRGGRYAFLQTGTLIAMIYDLFVANYMDLWLGLSTFLSFYLGIVFTFIMDFLFQKKHKEKYLRITLLSLAFLFMVPSLFFKQTSGIDLSYISIWSTGIMGGIILEGFKDLWIPSVTTMMTNNTRLLVKNLTNGIIKKEKKYFKTAGLLISVLLSFILGIVSFLPFYLYTDFASYSVCIPLLLMFGILIFEGICLRLNKKINLSEYQNTFISNDYIETEEENYVNHFIFAPLEHLKKLKLNDEVYEAVIAITSKNETKIKQNTSAKKLYICSLLEEERYEDLKHFLKKI